MTNAYAKARGVELTAGNAEALAAVPRKPLRPLSEKEQVVVAHRRQLIKTHMPELVPHIAELVNLGMVDGWRSVRRVEVFATGEVA